MKDRYKKKRITRNSFLSARGMTKIFMFLCLLGFGMPFMTVACDSQTLVSISGIDVMMGKQFFAFNNLVTTPTDPIIMLAVALCIITLIAAWLPNKPISKLIWGLASAGGGAILIDYLLTASNKLAAQANNMVSFSVPAQVSVAPGSGVIFCTLCFIASIIMLIRKLFFEEADLLVLTPDEREVYEAVKAEEAAGQEKRDELRRELEEKRKPLERFQKTKVDDSQGETDPEETPVTEKTEPTSKQPIEAGLESATEPPIEAEPEPVAEPPIKAESELTAEPPIEAGPEPIAEQLEPVSASPLSELQPVPAAEAPIEAGPEHVTEQPIETEPEPIAEQLLDIQPEPVSASPLSELQPEPITKAPPKAKKEKKSPEKTIKLKEKKVIEEPTLEPKEEPVKEAPKFGLKDKTKKENNE